MVLDRLVIVVGVLVLLAVAIALWRLLSAQRLRSLAGQDAPAEILGIMAHSGRSLLYFTTDNCTQCRFQQTPLLHELATATGVVVHTLDAMKEEQLARFYGIMTVPTTVVLDANGRPVAINHGLASLPTLRQQLEAATAA